MARDTVFEGKRYKITTDGRAFFFHIMSAEKKWELKDKNVVDLKNYAEALKDVKKILSLNMPEEEKILKICEAGFFRITNL